MVSKGFRDEKLTPAVGGYTLVGDGIGVLSLIMVAVAAVHHVDGIDEELGTPHSLNEVPRSSHFSLVEQLASTPTLN